MESYVVIGLGRFGTELATRLYACGEEVMVIDTDELLIDSLDTVLKVSSFQFSELLTDCSDYEIRVLLDVLVSAKDAMRKNSSFHYKPRK